MHKMCIPNKILIDIYTQYLFIITQIQIYDERGSISLKNSVFDR